MLKLILGALVGVVTAFALIYGIETIGHRLYPVATDVDFTDKAQVAALMQTMPVGGLVFVAAAWILGAYGGAMVALLAGDRQRAAGVIPPAWVFLATLANLFMIPHPVWMAVVGLGGIIAAGWLADRLFARKAA